MASHHLSNMKRLLEIMHDDHRTPPDKDCTLYRLLEIMQPQPVIPPTVNHASEFLLIPAALNPFDNDLSCEDWLHS